MGGVTVIELTFKRDRINFEALDAELRAALMDRFLGLTVGGGVVRVHLPDDDPTVAAAVEALVNAHDPTVLTSRQVEDQDADNARTTLAEQITARLQWHQANPVTTQNAVQVLTRMQVEWIHFLKLLRTQVR